MKDFLKILRRLVKTESTPETGRVTGLGGRWRPWLAVLLIGSAAAAHAQSGPAALPQVESSDAIFLGSLLAKQSFYSDDGRLIWTRHHFSVQESLRGPVADTIEVFELGGTVGEVSLTVSHGVSYDFNRAYLIFARRDQEGRLQTWGGPDGRLTVLEDASGKRLVRLGTSSPLRALMPQPRRAFYELSEIRARLTGLGPKAEETR